eukprot:SAG22_NODE_255_length_13562_cov_6.101463_10_plen_241_part_00
MRGAWGCLCGCTCAPGARCQGAQDTNDTHPPARGVKLLGPDVGVRVDPGSFRRICRAVPQTGVQLVRVRDGLALPRENLPRAGVAWEGSGTARTEPGAHARSVARRAAGLGRRAGQMASCGTEGAREGPAECRVAVRAACAPMRRARTAADFGKELLPPALDAAPGGARHGPGCRRPVEHGGLPWRRRGCRRGCRWCCRRFCRCDRRCRCGHRFCRRGRCRRRHRSCSAKRGLFTGTARL